MGQILTQHLFAEPFKPDRDTAVLNAILSDLYNLTAGRIQTDNIATGGVDTDNLAPGAVDDAALSDDQPNAATSISIVGSLDATTNIRQADVTWAQTGTVETEAWEVRWRVQGETTYLYEQTGTQSLRLKNLKPATTYEIGVDSISRTGTRAGYAVADETHLTGAGDQPPEVSLKVDKITAGTLAAQVVISGNIRTADSGQRVMMDSTGVALYDSAGNIVFKLNASTGAASWDTSGAASGTRVMIDQTGLKLFGTTPDAIASVPASFPAGNVGTCDSTTSLVMVKPTGVASGHVLLASVSNTGGTSIGITPPSGWALVGSRQGDVGTFAHAVYYKVAGGAEGATYTWTFSGACDARGIITAYSGVSNSTPIDGDSGAYSVSATTITPGAITPSVPNCMLVAFYGANPATASARLWGNDATVPANASASSAAVAVSTFGGRELIPDTTATPSRSGTSGVAAAPIAGIHLLLRPNQSFVNNTELSASSGLATFKGYINGSMVSGSQYRSAVSGQRIEIAPLYADDPAGGTAVKLYSGTAFPSIFAPASLLLPKLLNSGTANEQVGVSLSSGGLTDNNGTAEVNTSSIQLLSGQRDEILTGSYIGLLGYNLQVGGSSHRSSYADYGSAQGVVLLSPTQGGTVPSTDPASGDILLYSPFAATSQRGGLAGRNDFGDIWPWGPIRFVSDTGSDSGISSVSPTFESLSSDCLVQFTTRLNNALVFLTGQCNFVDGGAGWGSASLCISSGTTPVSAAATVHEVSGGGAASVSYGGAIASPGAQTFRLQVTKGVGAGTVTVSDAYLQVLVVG